MKGEYSADRFNRTALLLAHEIGDSVGGVGRHLQSHITIVAGLRVCRSRSGQAALFTAVKTAVRAFGGVDVALSDQGPKVLAGPDAGTILAAALTAEGARIVDMGLITSDEVVVLGDCPESLIARPEWLTASWTGWTAQVAPTGEMDREPVPVDGNVLAAIAAGALVIAERFFTLLSDSDASIGRRHVTLDMWANAEFADSTPPDLEFAPAQWWLLGLGHLGQGYAHAISWLDFAEPSEVQVVLQDTQVTVEANHSTGLLTPAHSDGDRKTRIAAASLDKCGYQTVIIERRMKGSTPAQDEDMHVALVGVDNLATRRGIDNYNWNTTIDVGIGSAVGDFDGMTILRFPGRPSDQIPAWLDRPGDSVHRPQLSAPGLDACGLTELNGVAVGASFVGAIAGALAVAEVCRPLHGGVAYAVQCHALRAYETEVVVASDQSRLPVSASLRRSLRS